MSQKYEAHISVWEDFSWRGTTHLNPIPLWVDSESLSVNKNIRDLQNLSRDGRVSKVQSQVGADQTPAGNVTFQPRDTDCAAVLFSHFQMGTVTGTTPYTYTIVPSKDNPTYTNNWIRGTGGYGENSGDVYSVSFLKKYFDTEENGGTNSIYFAHGICDKINFEINANADFILGCEYKFRDVIVGTTVSANPGGTDAGYYSDKGAWEWFEGTVLVEGESLALETITWECSNNLTQKSVVGRSDPDWFAFGAHTTEGEFSLDFPRDGMLQIGSMIGTKPFSIVGTLFKTGTQFLAFDMPYCVRKPFEVSLNNSRVVSTIPFIALEKDGTSPITLTLATGTVVDFFADIFWDAGTTFYASSRTLGDYSIVDGGTTFFASSRTLADYGIADRDLT